jgi:two-component system sensor histidine kinase RegB
MRHSVAVRKRQVAPPIRAMHHDWMSAIVAGKPDLTTRQNLRRLFLLRNFTILGIILGLGLAGGVLNQPLPVIPLAVILLLLGGLNILTWRLYRADTAVSDAAIFSQLLLDVAAVTGVFYYTGGASNPFIWFYLLPLIIAATILPRVYTWIMAGLTVTCYSVLLFRYVPLPHDAMHHDGGFQMHIFGMWLGFLISAGFVAVTIVGMAHSLRERDRKLAEAREQALQNERLVALGSLAAGAAHELGTPLGTMAILVYELEQEYPGEVDRVLHDKLGILGQQIARCKQALSVISATAGVNRAEAGHRMPVADYVQQVVAEWHAQRPGITLDTQFHTPAPDSDIIAERTLTQALVNILNNAADASPEDIRLEAAWTVSSLTLVISDRGPGLHEGVSMQLGRQPVTTKDDGMGVGLYLARATIQRLGGTLSIRNREQGGTMTRITLPLLAPDTTNQ